MNKTVRNKILKDNLTLILIGLACLIGGGVLNAIIYYFGWIISILLLVPILGAGLLLFSLFKLIYWPANKVYKSWKHYGASDSVIEEIDEAIKSKKKELDAGELIISKGWIIKPQDLVFVKPKDVNWIYFLKMKIKVFTTFGLSFEVNCPVLSGQNDEKSVVEFVNVCLNVLAHHCKEAIIGYQPEFTLIWKKNPGEFIEQVKKYSEKHK